MPNAAVGDNSDYSAFISQGNSGRNSLSVSPVVFPAGANRPGTDNYAAGGVRVDSSIGSYGVFYTYMFTWSDWQTHSSTNIANTDIEINGVNQAITAFGNNAISVANANRNIGNFLDIVAQSNFDGYIAEMIIYNRQLTAQEITDTEDYFTDKYGHY